jgi:hypothetical protein
MKSKIIIFTLLLVVSSTLSAKEEFKGLEWLVKYKDADGCIPISQLVEKTNKEQECPKEFSPQIRPMTIGTFNKTKTEAKRKAKKEVCCFDWKTLGNR